MVTVKNCDSIISTTLNVNSTYSISTSDETICDGDSVLIFGIYRIVAGTYYESLTSINSCDSIIYTNLIVSPLPTISFGGLDTIYYVNDTAVTLTGFPGGGTFSGPGISGFQFNPAIAGAGINIITYAYIDGNGCTNSVSQNVNVSNDIRDEIKVYPNPNRGHFTIEIKVGETQDVQIKITNILGQLIFKEELKQISRTYYKQINLKGYAKGIYNLQVTTNTGVINKRVELE